MLTRNDLVSPHTVSVDSPSPGPGLPRAGSSQRPVPSGVRASRAGPAAGSPTLQSCVHVCAHGCVYICFIADPMNYELLHDPTKILGAP